MNRSSTIRRSRIGKGLKPTSKEWLRKGLQTNDLDTLREVFKNFDLKNTGKINGRKLYQAFSALNMQKRSPEVFDIICKLTTIDHDIDEEEFIDILGGTIGNCETIEGGKVVFDRICTRKFIWKKEDKQPPKGIYNRDLSEDEEVDSDEERDVMPFSESSKIHGINDRLADIYNFELDENQEPMMSMETLGVMAEDLNRNMSQAEIESIFFGASNGDMYITKEAFMEIYKEKVMNLSEEQMNQAKKGKRKR